MKYRTHALLIALSCVFAACGPGDETPVENADPAGPSGGKDDGLGDFFGDIFERDQVFADVYNVTGTTTAVPFRGRLIEEEPSDYYDQNGNSMEEITQDEIEEEPVELRIVVEDDVTIALGEVESDEEGYFDTSFDASSLELEAGRYTVQVWHEDEVVGSYLATLLAPQRDLPIVRSDVDLTYLNTDFQSAGAMFGLMRESAEEKETLPGMDAVYKGLRGDDDLPITFLSGSPRFFKRVLERKMALDGIDQDGLVLKPFKDIITSNLAGFDFDELMPELKEQIGYKLHWLLKLRAQVPASTPEILMGDDSEADHVVYAIYYRLMSGEWDQARMMDELETLDVASDWRDQIELLAAAVEVGTPPIAIYINRTPVAGDHFPITEWTVEGVTRHHEGAWPLALDLWEDGMLSHTDVVNIQSELLQLGFSTAELDTLAKDAPFLEPDSLRAF